MFGDAQSTVELILKGKDEASPAFDAVIGKIDGSGGLTNLLSVGLVGAAGLAVGAVAAVGVAAFNFSQETDEAMRLVRAKTGLTDEALTEFETQALDVFDNNWGDSIGDVTAAMTIAKQVTGAEGEALAGITENALIMRDVFDKDVAQSIDASKVLMDEFGLSSEQAYDFITTGIQNGLDRNGDLLDTIGEYGNLFGDAGFSAEAFYAIMETGVEGGVLGTDKIADSIKEMQIILNEGKDDAVLALDTIGLNYDDMAAAVSTGQATWADYFPEIIGGLNDIEDPILRNQAQVAIFGTMAEDLGASFTEGLSTATTTMAEMEGATAAAGDSVSQGLGPAWEAFSRSFLVAIKPVGDVLGEILMDMIPLLLESDGKIKVFFDGIANGLDAWRGIFVNAGIAWDLFKQKILDFISPWGEFIDVFIRFGDWLRSNPFDFEMNFPELPDWATPGSPIPLHTAWKNFGDDLQRMDFTPQMNFAQVAPLAGAAGSQAPLSAAGVGGGNTLNIYVQDQATGQQLLRLVRELQRTSTVTVRQ